MTATLYWVQAYPSDEAVLSDRLLAILREKYQAEEVKIVMNRANIPYLEGLRDGGVEGAQDLIDALESFGYVRVGEKELSVDDKKDALMGAKHKDIFRGEDQ